MRSLESAFCLNYMARLVLLSMALVGCSKGGSVDSQSPAHTYKFETAAQVEEAWINFDVKCDGPCPENAGSLLSRNGTSMSTCSFSLVGSDVILTNRHCVPSEIANSGDSCDGIIQAIFMKNGKKDVYACDKVLSIAKVQPDTPKNQQLDYAYLKLKAVPSGRHPLKISKMGLEDREILTAITSTPTSSYMGPGAILGKKTCQVHMNSIIVDEFINGYRPVAAFKKCDIVSGNSGSAMLDQVGSLKAVAQANFSNTEKLQNPSAFTKRLLDIITFNKFAMGTNILCTENKELNLYPSPLGCDTGKDTYSAKATKEMEQSDLKEKIVNHNKIMNETSEFFMFTLKNNGTQDGDISYIYEPACIKGSKSSIPWIAKYAKKESISSLYVKMNVRVRFDIDDNARFKAEFIAPPVEFKAGNFSYVEIPVAKIAEQKQETYAVQIADKITSPTTTLQLPMCGQGPNLASK